VPETVSIHGINLRNMSNYHRWWGAKPSSLALQESPLATLCYCMHCVLLAILDAKVDSHPAEEHNRTYLVLTCDKNQLIYDSLLIVIHAHAMKTSVLSKCTRDWNFNQYELSACLSRSK
jgi:hypothetical protein